MAERSKAAKPVAAKRSRPKPNLDDFRAFYEFSDRSYFGFHLVLAARFFDKLVGQALKAEPAVTLPHWRVLSQLYLRDGMTVRRLAEHVAVDRAEISRSVRELEQAGLVARAANPADRRSPLLSLTNPGRDLTERLRRAVRQVLDSLIAGVPVEDLDAAERVLQAFTIRAFALSTEADPA